MSLFIATANGANKHALELEPSSECSQIKRQRIATDQDLRAARLESLKNFKKRLTSLSENDYKSTRKINNDLLESELITRAQASDSTSQIPPLGCMKFFMVINRDLIVPMNVPEPFVSFLFTYEDAKRSRLDKRKINRVKFFNDVIDQTDIFNRICAFLDQKYFELEKLRAMPQFTRAIAKYYTTEESIQLSVSTIDIHNKRQKTFLSLHNDCNSLRITSFNNLDVCTNNFSAIIHLSSTRSFSKIFSNLKRLYLRHVCDARVLILLEQFTQLESLTIDELIGTSYCNDDDEFKMELDAYKLTKHRPFDFLKTLKELKEIVIGLSEFYADEITSLTTVIFKKTQGTSIKKIHVINGDNPDVETTEIYGNTQVEDLCISPTTFYSLDHEKLKQLTNLHSLSLAGLDPDKIHCPYPMQDESIPFLQGNLKIRTLNLTDAHITHEALKSIVTCKNLETLKFLYHHANYNDDGGDDEHRLAFLTPDIITDILIDSKLTDTLRLGIYTTSYEDETGAYNQKNAFDLPKLRKRFPHTKIIDKTKISLNL